MTETHTVLNNMTETHTVLLMFSVETSV